MPRLKPKVDQTIPDRITTDTEYAVLYVRASDNFDAIDCANEWAQEHGFVRARELTLSVARVDGEEFFVARCYRLVPGER